MRSREEHVIEVVRLLKEERYQYEIKGYLTKEGVQEADFDGIMKEARTIYLAQTSKRRKLLWLSLTFFTFILFYFLIPNSIYNALPLIISFIGAALFTLFLAQSIADFRSWEEFNTKDKEKQDWRHKTIPFLVLPGLAMIFVFVMNFHSEEQSELQQFGEKVTGVVVDGSSIKSRRGGSYDVTVKFTTKGGKAYTVTESVGEHEFSSFYKGQKVELIYSKKDPSIIELLNDTKTVQAYTGSEERNLAVKDLLALLAEEHKEAGPFLNKINYGWSYSSKDSIWMNERKESAIKLVAPYGLKCVTYGNSFSSFPGELLELGFKPVETDDKKVKLYESDLYYASIQLTLKGPIAGTVTEIQRK